MGFLALNDQFFIPHKVMGVKVSENLSLEVLKELGLRKREYLDWFDSKVSENLSLEVLKEVGLKNHEGREKIATDLVRLISNLTAKDILYHI